MTRPAVRYAETADGLEIAYQVRGDGPLDVVIVPGLVSNLDRNADYPFSPPSTAPPAPSDART